MDTPEEIAKRIEEAGKRAAAEAEERRAKADKEKPAPKEVGGRGGLDPTRYGDWEIKGIACDF
jgi:hypothetical protein